MFIEERHQGILKFLNENDRITISDIQQKFNVSLDSARRDLRILEEKGLLKRTHGGAIPVQKVRVHPPIKSTARDTCIGNIYFDAIAKKAVEYISENDSVYICASSVGYLMTKHLPENIKFTVITNSIVVADELKYRENIETYVVGGKMRSRGFMSDALAMDFIKNMRMDISFISGAGFSAKFGLSNTTHETAMFQRTVIENSRKSICLMPNNRLGFEGFAKVVDAKSFDILITDWEALDEEISSVMDCGVEVVLANKPETEDSNITRS